MKTWQGVAAVVGLYVLAALLGAGGCVGGHRTVHPWDDIPDRNDRPYDR